MATLQNFIQKLALEQDNKQRNRKVCSKSFNSLIRLNAHLVKRVIFVSRKQFGNYLNVSIKKKNLPRIEMNYEMKPKHPPSCSSETLAKCCKMSLFRLSGAKKGVNGSSS